MSDLHKAFVKKMKHREMAAGLSILSEQEESGDQSLLGLIQEELKNSQPKQPPQPQILPQQKSISDAKDTTEVIESDSQVISQYELFTTSLFPVIEAYEVQGISLQTYYIPPKLVESPVFVFVHGAGSSSMSFAKLTEQLLCQDPNLGVLLYDLRGHGMSSDATDYSLEVLIDDFQLILNTFSSKYNVKNSIFLVGHSLGGAIVSGYAKRLNERCRIELRIKGICMLDIVEETAVQSLGAMPLFIAKRPKAFETMKQAISWHMRLLLHNEDSAKVSVPHLLKKDLSWKMDLKVTEPYWETWFKDLSKNFLSFTKPKLLVLSTHEALDKELIIGQMQGKYQLVVFNNNHDVGHFIQEDIPNQLSVCLLDFVKRNESPAKFMEQEMGISPKWGGKINT
jgi:protein phosphatase methylesterase 1